MGSKLVGKAILICSVSVLCILGVIYAANRLGFIGGGTNAPEPYSAVSIGEMSSAEYVQNSGNNIALGGNTKAFLSDETFWDVENAWDTGVQELTQEEIYETYTRVSLSCVSVQRDLRIQILDENGKRILGVPFFVTLDGVGEFKDLDQDGVIYIGDLDGGDYAVSVNPMEGYLVASSGINVHVKEELEYRAINDIALLMTGEDSHDLLTEMYAMNATATDRDDTEKTTLFGTLDRARMGIDVSSAEGSIDWKKVADAGIEFAILRAGFRGLSSGDLIADSKFLENVTAAQENGIRVGAYFFSQAISEKEAVEEASCVINLCRSYDLELPIFMGICSVGGQGRADALTSEERTQVCLAFLKTMKNAGYRSGVYAPVSFLKEGLDRIALGKYLTWIGEYREETTYEGAYQFWQYSGSGYVDGIVGAVNLNIGNLDQTNIDEYRSVELVPAELPEDDEEEEEEEDVAVHTQEEDELQENSDADDAQEEAQDINNSGDVPEEGWG